MSKRRVLISAKRYPPVIGGTEVYAEHIAHAYARAGFLPTVVTAFPGRRGWQTKYHGDVPISIFNVGEGVQPLIFVRLVFMLKRLGRSGDFDFGHATTWRGGLALLCSGFKAPKVLTVHGREVLINPMLLRPALRWTLNTFDIVLAVSRFTLDQLISKHGNAPHNKIWTVSYNGISYEEYAHKRRAQTSENTPVRIYTFCRLVDRKNIIRAIDAIKLVQASGVADFEYIIAGGGPLLKRVRERIQELDLTGSVIAIGRVSEDEIIGLYEAASIFLHPQISIDSGKDVEGFGLVIADAMSFGALAIAGRDGGPANFIEDQVTGILVDGKNPKAIADALITSIVDTPKRIQISNTGRTWVLKNLSWDKHIVDILYNVERLRARSESC